MIMLTLHHLLSLRRLGRLCYLYRLLIHLKMMSHRLCHQKKNRRQRMRNRRSRNHRLCRRKRTHRMKNHRRLSFRHRGLRRRRRLYASIGLPYRRAPNAGSLATATLEKRRPPKWELQRRLHNA